jgi:hypothetical protein
VNPKDRKKFRYLLEKVVKKDKDILMRIGLMGRRRNHSQDD